MEDYCEVKNQHGFEDFGFWASGGFHVMCCECKSDKLENKGNGMACSDCQAQFLVDCAHDY